MLHIETNTWEFGPRIKISNKINAFEILFTGTGDLFFAPVINHRKLPTFKGPIYFTISLEDGFLYESFINLYNKICAYAPFDYDKNFLQSSKTKEQEYQKRKDCFRDYPLVQENIISWHSDDECPENSSILNIKQLNNKNIQLEFIKNHHEDPFYMTYSIRFRNSGSYYDPFNFRFMELYNNLCNYYVKSNQEAKVKSLKKDNNLL